MKGIYNKSAINNMVEPLTNIISVFEKDARIVYECEKDNIFISIKNVTETIFCICTINAKNIIKNYEVVEKEIGIWDINALIKVLNLFQKDFYKEDLEVTIKDNCFVFKCGSDSSQFALASVNQIEEQRARVRSFDTSVFNECCKFTLNGEPLKKTIAKFNVFSELDLITFCGEKNKPLNMKLLNSSGALISSSETVFDNIICAESFSTSFNKHNFKGILNASDVIDFTIYNSNEMEMNVICAEYNNSGYEMQFFFSELIK